MTVRRYLPTESADTWDALHAMCYAFLAPKWHPCDGVMPFPARGDWLRVAGEASVFVAEDDDGTPQGMMVVGADGAVRFGAVDLTLSPLNGTGDTMHPIHAAILAAIWQEAEQALGVTLTLPVGNELIKSEWYKVEGGA